MILSGDSVFQTIVIVVTVFRALSDLGSLARIEALRLCSSVAFRS